MALFRFALAASCAGAARILDVGCEYGLSSLAYSRMSAAHVTGVDDERYLDFARKKFESESVSFESVGSVVDNDKLHDAALCTDLDYFLDRLHGESLIEKARIVSMMVARTLKENGKLICISPDTLKSYNHDPVHTFEYSENKEAMDAFYGELKKVKLKYLVESEIRSICIDNFNNNTLKRLAEGGSKRIVLFSAEHKNIAIASMCQENGMEVVGIVDEALEVVGTEFSGHKVLHPMNIGFLNPDALIISDLKSDYITRFRYQHLESMGVKIVSPYLDIVETDYDQPQGYSLKTRNDG